MSQDPREAVARLCDFFEHLTRERLSELGSLYAEQARFKDPFNEVVGVAAIRAIFEHMYERLDEPRFVVTQRLVDGDQAFLVWDFRFRFKGSGPQPEQTIRGGSHLRLASDGRVLDHRDYWDAAEELYEKLPVLGALMRWLKRKASQ
jgi:ketosteroid isomerase-like protein